jgi:hypothetical protein
MSNRERYVVELAQTVTAMFEKGNSDPAAEEIAEAHFPDKALGGEIIEGIRKRLRRVRDVLEQDFELPVYLLNHTYYTRFRENPPTTEADAKRCIPGGFRVATAGLRLNTDGDEDLIWQAMISNNLISGAGKVKKSVDRTLDAVEEDRLTKPHAARLMDRGRRKAEPNKPALANEVMKALPKKRS